MAYGTFVGRRLGVRYLRMCRPAGPPVSRSSDETRPTGTHVTLEAAHSFTVDGPSGYAIRVNSSHAVGPV